VPDDAEIVGDELPHCALAYFLQARAKSNVFSTWLV
jgi:hypothetical protein